MRKLSTILTITLPDYIESSTKIQKIWKNNEELMAYPGFCMSLLKLYGEEKQITLEEFIQANEFLKEKRNSYTFLADYLKDSNNPYHRLARILYYKNLIKELEENGN